MRYNKRKSVLKAPVISSADEAVGKVEHEIHGFEDDLGPFETNDVNMNKLRNLIRKIWEDAYNAGRDDARSDAAVEAAEAEWLSS